MIRPKRWSYSALSTYEECAAKYAYSYIYKVPVDDTSAAMERGTRLHGLCEDYMRDPTMPVPYDVRKIGRDLDRFRTAGGIPEEVWLVTKDWETTNDQEEAWVKGIVDLHYLEGETLKLFDYKSGREYPTHRGQLELYAILGLLKYPHAQRAESGAVYIDGGYTGQEGSIIRPMLPHLIGKWSERALRMEADVDFIASPGSACRWCPYKSSLGGPCGESAKAGV